MNGHELPPTPQTMTRNPTLSHDEIIQAQVFKLIIIWDSGVRTVKSFLYSRIQISSTTSIHTSPNVVPNSRTLKDTLVLLTERGLRSRRDGGEGTLRWHADCGGIKWIDGDSPTNGDPLYLFLRIQVLPIRPTSRSGTSVINPHRLLDIASFFVISLLLLIHNVLTTHL